MNNNHNYSGGVCPADLERALKEFGIGIEEHVFSQDDCNLFLLFAEKIGYRLNEYNEMCGRTQRFPLPEFLETHIITYLGFRSAILDYQEPGFLREIPSAKVSYNSGLALGKVTKKTPLK